MLSLTNHKKESLLKTKEYLYKCYATLVAEFDLEDMKQINEELSVDFELLLLRADKKLNDLLQSHNIRNQEAIKSQQAVYIESEDVGTNDNVFDVSCNHKKELANIV